MVNKGDLLSGQLVLMQRDPRVYDNAEEFSMKRDTASTEEKILTFGGPYHEKATTTNFKCPGQDFGHTLLAVFTMFFTRCVIKPLEEPIAKSGRRPFHFWASDEPFRVTSFVYNPTKNEN